MRGLDAVDAARVKTNKVAEHFSPGKRRSTANTEISLDNRSNFYEGNPFKIRSILETFDLASGVIPHPEIIFSILNSEASRNGALDHGKSLKHGQV